MASQLKCIGKIKERVISVKVLRKFLEINRLVKFEKFNLKIAGTEKYFFIEYIVISGRSG